MIARLLVLALLAVGCGGRSAPREPARAVDLTLAALDGGEIDTGAFRGKVVLLHAFTTWSLGATGDVEQLRALARAQGEDAVVIGLALDLEGYAVIAPWRKALDVPYLIAVADDRIRTGGTVLGRLDTVPTTIVLDPRGVIAHRLERPLAAGEAAALVARLIRR